MSERVLLVDDEEDVLWGISRALVQAGYQVRTAPDGESALTSLETEPVDLLVADIRMPGMSGLELVARVREEYPQVKALLMSAHGSEEMTRQAVERGALENIEKPFDLDLFLNRLKAAQTAGFRGVVQDMQLADVLQILSLEKATAAVEVSSGKGRGAIFFIKGRLTHALLEDKNDQIEGEEAFFRILSLEGGSFKLNRDEESPANTIQKSLDQLMFAVSAEREESEHSEGARGPAVDTGEEFDVESFSFSEALLGTEALEAAKAEAEAHEAALPAAPRGLDEEQLEAAKELLAGLHIDGLVELLLFDSAGGLALTHRGRAEFGPLGGGLDGLALAMGQTPVGGLGDAILTTESSFVVFKRLERSGCGLVVVMDKSGNPGTARIQLGRLATKLDGALSRKEAD